MQEDVSESVSAHYGCQPPAARPRNSQEVVRFAGIRRLGYILYEFGGFFPPKITDLRETPRHLANRHADSSRHWRISLFIHRDHFYTDNVVYWSLLCNNGGRKEARIFTSVFGKLLHEFFNKRINIMFSLLCVFHVGHLIMDVRGCPLDFLDFVAQQRRNEQEYLSFLYIILCIYTRIVFDICCENKCYIYFVHFDFI